MADLEEKETFLGSRSAQDEHSALPPRSRRSSKRGWVLTIAAALLALAVSYLVVSDSGKWGSRRYAAALSEADEMREGCDVGLQQSKLWQAPAVSYALCVPNASIPKLPPPAANELRFVVLGDWGRDGMCCQRDVAHRLDEVAANWTPSFLLNMGDNFYPVGITAPDDPQIASSWADVYGRLPSLHKLPWMSVAGNHDHSGVVGAQLALARSSRTWHMPALSYFETRGDVFFAFIDTTPMYYPPIDLALFATNFSTADANTRAQLRELDERLEKSDARFKIVVGHHPLFSIGHHFTGEKFNLARMRSHLQALFERHKVAAYFCGHEHSLEHAVSNGVHYFISGAGSKVRRVDNHTPENVFGIGRQGFMAASVRNDSMTVFIIDMAGVVLHSANITAPV